MIFWLIRLILGNIIKLIWVEKVNGIKNIPKKGGCIICANHSSYFDFLTLSAICPRRIYFLAGEVFFRKWQWKWLMKLTQQIKIDRKAQNKSQSINQVIQYLKEGKVIGIFPEGTRSADGKLQKAYSGAVKIAISANVPIVPVGINGTFEIMSRFDKYPRFNKKCGLFFEKAVCYDEYFGKTNDKFLLTDLTQSLMQKIGSLCNKEYNF